MKCAVFSCLGLGDGLISLVLSNNLQLNGHSVTTFHPFLSQMQEWFPHLPLSPFPQDVDASFDKVFVVLEKTPWMNQVLKVCLEKYRDKTTILNPIATPHRDYPYWEEGKFDGNKTFVENLYTFCQCTLQFKVVTKSNGITPSEGLISRCESKRVLLHPTSSREGKNWGQSRYLQLYEKLEQEGFAPMLLLTDKERVGWDLKGKSAPLFDNLCQLARTVYESGFFIGNDSGLGHLASCLGVPTLTLCRSAQNALFWRPAWTHGAVLCPRPWVLNMKWLRLRDKYWSRWISLNRVLSSFRELRK